MSNGPQRIVLVVDPDPGSAAALGPALRREGYQIRIARDGARALQVALARAPDVMLVDEATPGVGPRTLVRILRSNPRTSAVPILYAGRDRARMPDGANAFVAKPLDANDVLASLRRLIAERAGAGAPDDERVEGSLSQLPLPDVLQMLGNNRRSGRLVVTTDDARAEIGFGDGEVVDAVLGGSVGEKAIFRALALREGRFVFQPGEWTSPPRIERPVTELLLQGLGYADELAALSPQLPARDALLLRTAAPDAPELGPVVAEVRGLLEAPRRFSEVLDRCSAGDLDVARAIATLLASGEVRVADTSPAESVAPEPFLAQGDVHALLTRLRPAIGSGPAIGKVVLACGDPAARRSAVERLSEFAEFRCTAPSEAGFGTVGALELAEVRLDVVLLPDDEVLLPLWGPLVAGALAVLVLGPAAPAGRALATLIRLAHAPVGWCGLAPPADTTVRSDEGGYLGPDPGKALRALVVRAVARPRSS